MQYEGFTDYLPIFRKMFKGVPLHQREVDIAPFHNDIDWVLLARLKVVGVSSFEPGFEDDWHKARAAAGLSNLLDPFFNDAEIRKISDDLVARKMTAGTSKDRFNPLWINLETTMAIITQITHTTKVTTIQSQLFTIAAIASHPSMFGLNDYSHLNPKYSGVTFRD